MCGLQAAPHPEFLDTVILTGIEPGTQASHIRNWRSRLRNSVISMVDDIPITSTQQLRQTFADLKSQKRHHSTHVRIQFARPRWAHMNGEGIPSLAFDQLNVIAHHLSAIRNGDKHSWRDSYWPDLRDHDLDSIIRKGVALPKLTRRHLKTRPAEWEPFLKSEWTQLNKYDNQGMFGTPIPKPRHKDAVILPWVWSYVYKTDPLTKEKVAKSRGTCNGGQRYGKIVTLAETYAACVEQHAHRLFWALVANQNYICLGADVGNAFAEADGPEKTFYMYADEPFRQWWTEHKKNDPLPPGYVIPIKKNLQGHPEGPRLWNKHVDKLLCDPKYGLNFKQTTHEPCLYYKYDDNNNLILMLRQVDDFLIAGPDTASCTAIRTKIQGHMKNKLNDLGTVQLYNGIDVEQTRDYVKLSVESYIDKINEHHGWKNEPTSNVPIPMRSDSQSLKEIQTSKGPDDKKGHKALQDKMGFSYRQAIGELIYAMSTCRVDIASAVIQLSQFSAAPAEVHYKAVKQIFLYLNATKSYGLYYWRESPRLDLPLKPPPTTVTDLTRLNEFPDEKDPGILWGASDATWAADRLHRRSVSGTALLLSGAVVYYRCQIQPTIALSSSESEFAAMADAGKAAMYLRSILAELGLLQKDPTKICADNHGAICLANAQQPTRRTKHIDIKQMVILQWTDEDKLQYVPTKTENNISDCISKPVGRIKHYEQNDVLMGRRRPAYSKPSGTQDPVVHSLTSLFSTDRIFTTLPYQECLDSVSVAG